MNNGTRLLTMARAMEKGDYQHVIPNPLWRELIYASLRSSNQASVGNVKEVIAFTNRPVVSVLLGGGIDSAVAYWMAVSQGHQVRPYTVEITTRYREYEKEFISLLGAPVRVVDIGGWIHNWDMHAHLIPMRNTWIALLVADDMESRGEPGEIWLSPHSGEITEDGGDKSRNHKRLVNQILRGYWQRLKLVYPVARYSKRQLVLWAANHGYADLLRQSRTCQRGKPLHCGQCDQCFQRYAAVLNTEVGKGHSWAHLGDWDDEWVERRKQMAKACLETRQRDPIMGLTVREAIDYQRAFRSLNQWN